MHVLSLYPECVVEEGRRMSGGIRVVYMCEKHIVPGCFTVVAA